MILVLVDVDNLIGQLKSPPSAGALVPSSVVPRIEKPSRLASPVQVCLAMNLKSAAAFADWKTVETLAAQLARKIAPSSGEHRPVDVALCLSVPEAADQALLHLFGYAPTAQEEPSEEIWLLSRDGGLQRTVGYLLETLCPAETLDGGRCWRLPEAIGRSTPGPSVVLGEAALTLPGVTALLDSPERCVAVAGRRVQCPASWTELLDVLARNPWVLSQVGVTFHDGNGGDGGSVQGVARLRACLSGEEPRLECAPQDGVEYGVEGKLGAWGFKAQNPTVTEASVGPGAVRVSWHQDGKSWGLTLRSQLPAWLVAACPDGLQATPEGEPRIDECTALGTRTGLVGGPSVKVRLAFFEETLSVKVTEGRACWWWSPSAEPWKVPTPKGTAKIPGVKALLPTSLYGIDAVQGVAPGACLYLRSPIQSRTHVKLLQPLNPGEIGLGEVPESGIRCAVWAPRRMAKGPVSCVPVQEASVKRLEGLLAKQGYSLLEAQGLIPLLQELPLVLPLPAQQALNPVRSPFCRVFPLNPMSNHLLRLPETPSELLAWLASLDRDPSGLRASPAQAGSPAMLASLADELPAFLGHTVLREAPREAFSQQAWLRQIDQLKQAQRGCSSLNTAEFPWAHTLATHLSEALEQRAGAMQALLKALEQDEPEEDEDDDVLETPLEQAWGVLRGLRRLSAQPSLNDGRDLAEARKCAQALLEGTWVAAFREASEAMNPGAQEPGEDLGWWVAYGLEARLLLESIAGELLAPELFDDIERVDGVLAPFSPALAVIPGDDYDDIASLGGFPEGWASWREQHAPEAERLAHDVLERWGKQETSALARNEKLARMLSWSGAQARLGVLEAEHRLARSSKETPQFAAAAASNDTVAFLEGIRSIPRAEQTERLDQLFAHLKGISCPWMREDLAQATEALLGDASTAELVPQIRARLRPEPGNVPLLLVLTGTSFGDVWQLRVRRRSEPGDPWEKSGILQTVARDAIRTAFEAAAACMPQGLPPRPFEEHSIELVGGAFNGIDAIDGQSVGLAAALAFVSLWLDASIPEDLACSAAIRSDGGLYSVGFVREKSEALARITGRPVRLLLSRGSLTDFPERIPTIHAQSLEEALEFAHLAPHHTQAKRDAYIPWLGSVTDRLERLARYQRHVEQQNLADYRGKGMDPWLVLGDRIRLLIDSLSSFEDAQTRQEVARARADAALAFTHGLDGFSANQMLRGLDRELLHPSVRLYAGIVELDHLLDKCNEGDRSWEETLPFISSLEQALAALSETEKHTYEGRVLGTIGRVWMHQRKLPEAIDYLRRAVNSHDAHLWKEAGRSRIYLATALRMSGSLDEAAKTLDAAMPLLDRCRHQWNASYAEHTVLFWTYELARLLLELERPLDAIAALESRLRQARALGAWPLAGMLRTLAWSAAIASLPDKQKGALEELQRIAGEDPFLCALHREASGPLRSDGEVY